MIYIFRSEVVFLLCSMKHIVHFGLSICLKIHTDTCFLFLSFILILRPYLFHTKYKILSILGFPFIFTRFFVVVFFKFLRYQLYYIDHICYIINYETFFHYRIPLDFHYSNFKRVALNIKTKRHVVFNKIEGRCIKYEDFNEIM